MENNIKIEVFVQDLSIYNGAKAIPVSLGSYNALLLDSSLSEKSRKSYLRKAVQFFTRKEMVMENAK